MLHLYALWLFAAPLVLVFQALPISETETRVVVENDSGLAFPAA
jgi:hypothetical protein